MTSSRARLTDVVSQLLEAGHDVRALTRRPATAGFSDRVEVVDAPDLTGMDAMYLFPVEELAQEWVDRAKAAGVRRIVDLSAASVTVGLHNNPVERIAEESGLRWTHVRPGGFMANMLQIWGPSIRAERVVRYPFADVPMNMIHEADIAAVAVAALTGESTGDPTSESTGELMRDDHHGMAYTLTGPGGVTVRDQVAAISDALGEEVRYEEVSRERAREIMRSQGGFAAEAADLMLGFTDYDGGAATGDDGYSDQDWSALERTWPDVEKVTGRAPRTFAEWARDHRDDFR